MNDKRSLYEKVILDHNKQPRNFGKLEGATRSVEGYNPLCGDHFTVHLKINGDTVEDVRFEGSGCAISKSSASVMTSLVKGKSRAEAEDLFNRFHTMITSEHESPLDEQELGKMMVFSGVRDYPVRIKCATLAWHTLMAALHGEDEPVSTE